MILVWIGVVIVAAGLVWQQAVAADLGPFAWALGIPMAAAGVLAWLSRDGSRWALLGLVALGLLITLVGAVGATIVVGLSLGQSPITSFGGWLLPPLGGLLIAGGSTWALVRR